MIVRRLFGLCCLCALSGLAVAAAPSLKRVAIGGGSVAEPVSSGDYLYIPRGATLEAWNLHDLTQPTLAGRTDDDPEHGPISSVTLSGSYLYAVSGGYDSTGTHYDHLTVFSLTTPAHPVVVKRLARQPYISDPNGPYTAVVTSGAYVYVLDVDGGLHVFNIATPANPQALSLIPAGPDAVVVNRGANGDDTVAIFGSKLVYTGCQTGEASYLEVFDLTAPAVPLFAGSAAITASCNPDIADIALTDGYAITVGNAINIFDFRTPANIASVFAFQIPFYEDSLRSLAVAPPYFYTTRYVGSAGVEAWNFAQPTGAYRIGGTSDAIYKAEQDQIATTAFGPTFVKNTDDAVILDTTYPIFPTIAANLQLTSTQTFTRMAFDQTHAYMSGDHYGFKVVNPQTLAQIGRYDEPRNDASAQPYMRDIAVQNHTVYLLDGYKVIAVDVTDPTAPVRLGEVVIPANALRLSVIGNRAYVAGYGVTVVDITNAAAMQVMGSLAIAPAINGIEVRGNYAYVSGDNDGNGSFRIVDISNPVQPVLKAENGDCSDSFGLDVSADGSTAYVGCLDGALHIFNVRDPALIVSVSAYVVPLPPNGPTTTNLRVVGNHAYLGSDLGIHEIDVSHLSAPVQTAFTPTYQTVFTTEWSPYQHLFYAWAADAGTYVFSANAIFNNGFE